MSWLFAIAACVEPDPVGTSRRLVDVVSAPGAGDEGFADVSRAVNGVRGGGRWQGGLDVYSLGGEELILSAPEPVVDQDGPELAVFENPFDVDGGGRFMDPTVVEVSADCERFVPFPHDYAAPTPGLYVDDPSLWTGFAGIGPVELHAEERPLDPLDPVAGGDRFDLADLADPEVQDWGFVCVRLTSARDRVDARTGRPWPSDPVSDGADIDGVYVRR